MATKTRSAGASKTSMKSKSKTRSPNDGKKSSHLSALMMLSSQLLSNGRFNDGLPSFVTRGVDSEQIWQQLELRNHHKLAITGCTKELVNIQRSKRHKRKRKITEENNNRNVLSNSENETDSDSSDNEVDGALDSIKKRLVDNKDDDNEIFDFGESDEDELDFDFDVEKELSKGLSDEEKDGDSEDESLLSKAKSKKKVKRTTIVDDKFFKMADMEEFLDAEDLKEEKRIKQESMGQKEKDSSDEDEDDDIDMFAADSDDDNEAAEAKYSDFFDPVDDEEESNKENQEDESVEEENSKKSSKLKKKNSLNKDEKEEIESDEMESDDEDDDGDEDDNEDQEMDDDEDVDDSSDKHIDSQIDDVNKDSMIEKSKKKVSFSKNLFDSDEDDTSTPDKLGIKTEQKSSFELKQEKLKAKAREMEELSLKETPWELTGETSSVKRPENSLLETVMDFQHTTRSAPVITDDTTKSLEDFIKQRIKDKTFDDVERKEKPKEDVFEFKKRIVLDQEKSKQSLGELYEQEFLKQQQQDTEEVKADPECEKIESELNKLFFQLDALSNFRYTPMKPGSEVKIIVNTPAIAMEEVAPVATADSYLLAPEEIREKKKGVLKAADERDSSDKKRARRQKKLEKRERKKAKEAREKVVEKLKPGMGNKYSKQKALKQLEEISKSSRNVTLIKGDNKKLASSSAFFSQLQEEVQTNVKAKKGASEKKKKKVDPSKLML